MTGDPGDPGEPRTLQDPLAESLRVVDLATDRGLLVRLMGGMAIRAHAPDWPARRVRARWAPAGSRHPRRRFIPMG